MTLHRERARLAFVAVLLAASLLYLHSLGEAPVNVGVDEARFAIPAQSIAATGRTIDGTRMPLFFHIVNPLSPHDPSLTWWQPTLFYLMAAVFRVASVSEWTARLPTTALAILDLCLIYLVARRVFSNAWYGVLAAGLLALTPAHFLFARQAQDYLCQLPMALAWLWCLIRCMESDASWYPGLTGLLLGLGFYGHISSWIVVPIYLAITVLVLWRLAKRGRDYAALAVGVAVPLLPIVPWLWFHPSLPRDMLTNYRVVRDIRFADRVEIYWDYFNPSFLFFSGGSNPMFATRRAGVFPLAAALLIPLGIWNFWRRRISLVTIVVLIGFALAPFPIVAALPEDPKYYTPRDLLVIPYGVLLCTAGVEWLLSQRRRTFHLVAVALVVAVPVQFVSFARNYFTEYQSWSASRFDALNLRGVAEYVFASNAADAVPAIYLSEDVGEPQAQQWVFYLLKRHRPDLWMRTKQFHVGRFDPNDVPAGSLLVLDAHHPGLAALLRAAGGATVHRVNDVTGAPAAIVIRRQ